MKQPVLKNFSNEVLLLLSKQKEDKEFDQEVRGILFDRHAKRPEPYFKVYFKYLHSTGVEHLVYGDLLATRLIEGGYVVEEKVLDELLPNRKDGVYIQGPVYFDYGIFTTIGKNSYANFNLTCVDDTHIYVGNNVLFGPNVTLAVATHPVCPTLRKQGYQSNHSIRIGNNVWIGANTIILKGVTIGDNVVIGSNVFLLKSIPANSKCDSLSAYSLISKRMKGSLMDSAAFSASSVCFFGSSIPASIFP